MNGFVTTARGDHPASDKPLYPTNSYQCHPKKIDSQQETDRDTLFLNKLKSIHTPQLYFAPSVDRSCH